MQLESSVQHLLHIDWSLDFAILGENDSIFDRELVSGSIECENWGFVKLVP
jgi:hypothetical protein